MLTAMVALGAVAGVMAPVAAAAPVGEVLVTASDGARLPASAQQVARIAGLRFFTVAVPDGVTAGQYAARLERRAGVTGAQPNAPLRRASVSGTCVDAPAAPLLDTTVTTNARSRTLPVKTGAIAVLDTGVDPTVPELAGRVLAASDALGGANPALPDDDGHGTQVAAAAAGAPGLVAGISPTSPIMPIRIAIDQCARDPRDRREGPRDRRHPQGARGGAAVLATAVSHVEQQHQRPSASRSTRPSPTA